MMQGLFHLEFDGTQGRSQDIVHFQGDPFPFILLGGEDLGGQDSQLFF